MIRYTLAIAVAIAASFQAQGFAQDESNYELTQPIAELEARLNQMEEEQLSYVNTVASAPAPACSTDVCSDVGCGSCGDTCCSSRTWCCPEAGAFGEFELLYFSLKGSDNDVHQDEYYSGTRTTAGYMNDKGRGFQVRYFEMQAPVDGDGLDGDGSTFHVDTLDFEYLSRFTWGCNWRGDIGMGLRLMDLNNGASESFEDMVGLVIGINLISEMTDNFSVYSRLRQSFVYGNLNDEGTEPNIVVPISELAMGLEYARDLNSAELFLRGGVEGQVFFDTESNEEAASLIGLGVALGFRR